MKQSRQPQRGTSLVEIPMAVIPLLAMLLTIVDFSIPIFLRSLMTHAVREGCRYAITFRTEPGKSQTVSIQNVVMTNSSGFLSGDGGRDKVKVRFYSPVTFEEVEGPNRNASGNIVEVSVEGLQWSGMVDLWRTSGLITISAKSADRLETLPRGTAPPTP
ncbi:MAG: pilus assembly protein [Bryobacterales bacterium]|nr:pilus assembly protein [Bryobacterales bacterium]